MDDVAEIDPVLMQQAALVAEPELDARAPRGTGGSDGYLPSIAWTGLLGSSRGMKKLIVIAAQAATT